MFDLQGHRFARGLFPENTLAGFDGACRLGLRSFEIDIAVTRDGVPVVHHDPALNPDTTRGPDGHWLATGPLIKDLSLDELARFDVGRLRPSSRYAATYPDQVPSDGARVPTLETVLRHRDAIRFNIELKLFPDRPDWTVSPEAMVDRVIEAVTAAGALDRVTIQSFDWRAPRLVRRLYPGIPCGWLSIASAAPSLWRGVADDRLLPDAIADLGGGTWTPFHAELTPALLRRAQTLGVRVVPWTVNDPVDMARLIDWGVDGLITDRPDRALPLLPSR